VFVIKHSTEANSGSVLQVQHMTTCRCLSEHMQVCLNVGSCTSVRERERERERESTLRKAQAMLGSSYRNRKALEVEILVTFVEF
jgi:hypothetical protein